MTNIYVKYIQNMYNLWMDSELHRVENLLVHKNTYQKALNMLERGS